MDIKTLTGSNPRPEGTTSGAKPRDVSTPTDQPTAKSASTLGESVTLTQTAKSMKAAQERAGTAPFNDAKVAELKSAIAEGRYTIDTARLSERMLSAERLLS